ncbi:hypothetical protein F2Q70_00002465 [Brassica cretica]|uniref:Uncharacterized protein n=1 Tax=Brassica cretica TaxID=69181 RepID=A0A8S9IN70_BRACR|nr:hypothetical protein F2Q68_00020387 [Brassica cretica]KAF2570985.1 hypothetical protein F2Q70_00002465 [Brassica cretica]
MSHMRNQESSVYRNDQPKGTFPIKIWSPSQKNILSMISIVMHGQGEDKEETKSFICRQPPDSSAYVYSNERILDSTYQTDPFSAEEQTKGHCFN